MIMKIFLLYISSLFVSPATKSTIEQISGSNALSSPLNSDSRPILQENGKYDQCVEANPGFDGRYDVVGYNNNNEMIWLFDHLFNSNHTDKSLMHFNEEFCSSLADHAITMPNLQWHEVEYSNTSSFFASNALSSPNLYYLEHGIVHILGYLLLAVIICAVGIHSKSLAYCSFLCIYGIFRVHSFTPSPFTFSADSSTLPSNLQTERVCGAYYGATNSVYLFGGLSQLRKVTRYDDTGNFFEALPDSPVDIGCVGQSVAVMDDIVYVGQYNSDRMMTYNISSGLYNQSNIASISRSHDSCFANANGRYLFVVGDHPFGYPRSFRIYDGITKSWSVGPNTTMDIQGGACTVHNNYLYVFGGVNSQKVTKIDIGDITNILNYNWITLSGTLSKSLSIGYSRAAVHVDENMIYYLGAENGIVDAVDTTTDIIHNSLSTTINSAWGAPATIIRRNGLFLFGGILGACCSSYSSIFQYTSLQTSAPTDNPTLAPTNAPSAAPTAAPTNAPSAAPTACTDYKEKSNDGRNETSVNIEMILDVNNYDIHDMNTLKFETSNILDYSESIINCTASHCFIKCNETGSCLQTKVRINNIYNKSVTLFCEEQFSCVAASIYTDSFVSMANINIICSKKYSCLDMMVNIANITLFNLYCLEDKSCVDVDVNIESDDGNNTQNRNDGIIHCIALNGCNGLTITTTSPQTKLVMVEYSENVILNNGFGATYDPPNILCNVDRFIRLESTQSITTNYLSNLVQNEYNNQQLPCSDVTIECGNASCSLTYRYYTHTLSIPPNTGCYWVNVQEIQSIICEGECINSPTSPPTSTPTKEPTHPTNQPSDAPTSSPTAIPSFSPVQKPTIAPTSSPSGTPTSTPTIPPTSAPSRDPTNAPTSEPSDAPSQNPSTSPSEAPSDSPTKAPTRNPTQNMKDIYHSFIDIVYVIENLESLFVKELEENTLNLLPKILEIIESEYFVKDVVEYQDFTLQIKDINGFEDLSDIYLKNGKDIKLNSQILSRSDVAGVLLRTSKKEEFSNAVTTDLKQKVFKNNTNLFFYVENDESLQVDSDQVNEEKESYLIIIISAVIVGAGLFGSVFVKASNKKQDAVIDDAGWTAPLLYSLQIYDFISDINLCYDILSNPLISEGDSTATVILWCGIFSVIVTAISFMSNLYYSIGIKKQTEIQNNRRADEYFIAHIAVFIALTVLCGGCYPALMMVSSGMFGLNMLQSGLTKHELNRLTKIKIKSTITLENGPQLIIQIIYAIQLGSGSISSAVFLAFVGSTLSVVLAVASFCANKENRKDAEIMTYYLRFYNKTGTKLEDEEEQNIVKRKGRTEELRKSISKVFGVSHDNIQIGYVWILKDGLEMYIAHYLSKAELSKHNKNNAGYMSQIKPKQYLKNLYKKKKVEINNVFKNHFGIQSDEFVVDFKIDHDDVNIVDVNMMDDDDQHDRTQLIPGLEYEEGRGGQTSVPTNKSMQIEMKQMMEAIMLSMNGNDNDPNDVMENNENNQLKDEEIELAVVHKKGARARGGYQSLPTIKSMQTEMHEMKEMMEDNNKMMQSMMQKMNDVIQDNEEKETKEEEIGNVKGKGKGSKLKDDGNDYEE